MMLNPLTNLHDLQKFIELHINQLEHLTEKRDSVILELDKIESERLKLTEQLDTLFKYQNFLKGGFRF